MSNLGVQFVCVKVGTAYGPEYVQKLHAGLKRCMPVGVPWDFTCYTDRPVPGINCKPPPANVPGWWVKVALFKLRKPMIYLDLDVVVVGDLQPLIDWQGFGLIGGWVIKTPGKKPCYRSGAMVLTGGEGYIWDAFEAKLSTIRYINFDSAAVSAVIDGKHYHGDQDWIVEHVHNARAFPFGDVTWFPCYKKNDFSNGFPHGTLVVMFKGVPKPSDIKSGWVPKWWRAKASVARTELLATVPVLGPDNKPKRKRLHSKLRRIIERKPSLLHTRLIKCISVLR